VDYRCCLVFDRLYSL